MIKFKTFLEKKDDNMKTLYVKRDLLNGDELAAWAKKVGFKQTLLPEDMHITCAYSTKEVDWSDIHLDTEGHRVHIESPDLYEIKPLGDEGAVVLKFHDDYLEGRWEYFKKHGASWDYESYQPHVSITYDGEGIDVTSIYKKPDMILKFGPEKRNQIDGDVNWKDKIKEK